MEQVKTFKSNDWDVYHESQANVEIIQMICNKEIKLFVDGRRLS